MSVDGVRRDSCCIQSIFSLGSIQKQIAISNITKHSNAHITESNLRLDAILKWLKQFVISTRTLSHIHTSSASASLMKTENNIDDEEEEDKKETENENVFYKYQN